MGSVNSSTCMCIEQQSSVTAWNEARCVQHSYVTLHLLDIMLAAAVDEEHISYKFWCAYC
jgi:hypothetical protein